MPTPPFPTGDEEEPDDLASLVGRTFMDLNTGFVGIVKTREDRQMGTVYWLSDASGKAQDLKTGAQLVDQTRQVVNVSPSGTVSSGGKLSEGEFSALTGGGATGGGGGGATSTPRTQFASEAALDVARAQQAVANAELARAQTQQVGDTVEQNRLDRELEQARIGLDNAKFEYQKWADQQGFNFEQQGLDLRAGELNLSRERLGVERDTLNASIASDEANLAWSKEQFGIAEANADRRQMELFGQQIDLLEMQIDNSQRELAYSEFGATKRTVIQEQGATQRELMKLGPDPFRQQAILSGQAQRGITPQQQVAGQAMSFINQPLPQASLSMELPQLESALAGIQGIKQPTLSGFGVAGMAEGGVIEMTQNDGVFSMKPASLKNEKTYLVGDAAGIIPGVTETLTVKANDLGGIESVKVSPIAGTAQAGMSLGAASTEQMLRPMFSSLGFTGGNIPRATTFDPIQGLSTGSTAAELMRLGLVPEFVRDPNTGAIWQIKDGFRRQILDPESMAGIRPQDVIAAHASEIARFAPNIESLVRDPGTGMVFRIRGDTREHIGDPAALAGIRPGEATPMSLAQIEAMAPRFGGTLTSLEDTTQPAFRPMGTPLMEASTRSLLPAPFKIAPQLAQWSVSRPELFSNVLSAYGSALDPVTGLPTGGLSPDVVRSQIRNASLFGSGLRGTALG